MTVGQVIAKLGVDPKEYEKGLKKAEAQADKAGLKIGNIFKNAFSVTLGVGMFEALKKGFKSTVGTAISFNSMLQTAQIGFATMLGSAEKAQKFLDDMADFAAKTPFEYPELLDAARKMLAYGFAAENVLPTLRAVGDATAALGMGGEGIDRVTLALGQILAKGKLSGEEMRQLTEAGVPAWHILAEAMGKTVPELQDMVSKGLVPGGKAVEMLTNGMTKRFGGMMASMEDTWQGVTSSIKDIWSMTVGEMTSGLFSSINTWLKGVRDWLSGFYDTFKQFGLQTALLKYFGAEFATMANVAIWAAKTVFNAFGWVYGILRKNWGMVSVLATAFLTYATASKIAAGATATFRAISLALKGELSSQIPILGWVSKAVGIYKVQMALASMQGVVMTGVLAKLKVALYSLWTALGPIGWAILAITAIVAGGMALWNKYAQSVQKAWETSMAEKMKAQQEKLQDSMKGVTGATEDQTDALADAAKAASKNLQSFDEVHQLQEDMSDTAAGDMFAMPDAGLFDTDALDMEEMLDFDIEGPKTSLSGFWEWIKQEAGNLWEGVKEKWGSFKEWAGDMWEGAKEKWGNFTGWVEEKWSSFKDRAGEIWTDIKTKVQTKWEELKTNAPVIWEDIKTSIQDRWDNLKTSAGETWSSITTRIEEKWNTLKTNAPTVWENIKTSIQDRWNTLKTNAPTVWENIKGEISQRWEDLKTNAPTTWENIKTEISNRWHTLKTNASTTWENIKKEISDRWNTLKTNAPTAWENIKTSIQTRWESLKIQAGETWGNIKTVVEEKWNALKTNAPVVWENIKTSIQDRWDSLASGASEKWGNIKSTISEKWGELKTNAPTVWENIKDEISQRWEELKVNAPTTWDNIKEEISNRWETLKTNAPTAWNNISKTIKDSWKDLKTSVPTAWNDIKKTIADKWREIKEDALSWGKNMIDGFVQGIKDKIDSVKSTLKNVGNTIKDFLGFSSPTKEGPGRDADKWAPSFMDMYRKGISQGIPSISSSLAEIAEEMAGLATMTVQPAVRATASAGYTADSGMMSDTIAQAVYRAIIDAFRITQASSTGTSSGESKELVLKIDNTVLARMQLPAIIREGQRQGLNLVVQPQGV